MEVLLEPTSWDNIGDILAHSGDSISEFYSLPRNEREAERYIGMVENQSRHRCGYWFNAYELAGAQPLVGGGQIYNNGVTGEIGWWVVAAYRRRGYGKAIAQALEGAVKERFPDLDQLDAIINKRNLGSCALAASMGFARTQIVDENGLITYRKALLANDP
jgi:RimJ/RimL family protein N-acetyltransferase